MMETEHMAKAVEKAAEGQVPFTGQSFSLFNPMSVLFVITSLALGFGAFSLSKPMGEALADWFRGVLASLTGRDVPGDSGDSIEVV